MFVSVVSPIHNQQFAFVDELTSQRLFQRGRCDGTCVGVFGAAYRGQEWWRVDDVRRWVALRHSERFRHGRVMIAVSTTITTTTTAAATHNTTTVILECLAH